MLFNPIVQQSVVVSLLFEDLRNQAVQQLYRQRNFWVPRTDRRHWSVPVPLHVPAPTGNCSGLGSTEKMLYLWAFR
jgi:hypothetical protein